MLPFIPKSRSERVISVGLDDQGSSQSDQALGCLTKVEDSLTDVHILFSHHRQQLPLGHRAVLQVE